MEQKNNNVDEDLSELTPLPSAKLLLATAQKENDYEIDRKKTFETRSGIFIGFSGVLFTLLSRVMDFDIFKNVQPTKFISYALLFGIFFLLPLILLIISVYCFLHVIIVKKYTRFDLTGFDSDSAALTEEQSAFYLMEKYRDVVNINSKVNDTKSIFFLIGVLCIGCSALLISSMYIISYMN
ncbi:MAG TPA: hypothetical protein VGI33_02180 [Paenibacillus sp.]|jgi:branched-subunit amino acid transport protein AzlD